MFERSPGVTHSATQVAHFERVQFSLRNFDLVFVFKDFSLMHINSIPMESLDTIKEWLDSCNIKYYEGPHNLNWSRIIAHIKARPVLLCSGGHGVTRSSSVPQEDPAKFYEEGGFEFLNTESSSDEGEGDDESEDESGDFKPPESDSDDSDSDEDDSDAYSAVSEDESESGSGDEEDENAPTWEELEEVRLLLGGPAAARFLSFSSISHSLAESSRRGSPARTHR
jgi:nucleosome binding factor SPN SPT16 subunit